MFSVFKDGLGEESSFKTFHPIVNIAFYFFVLAVTMFSMSPAFLGVSFVCSWLYSVILGGKKQIKTNVTFMLPIILFTTLINTLFTHNGSTVLFYINDLRVTLEAFVYGLAAAVLLTSVIVWFMSFNVIMSSDKLIYMFGKVTPVLGLTLSMIFRFIPLLKERYREISIGQRAMGRPEETKLIPKIRRSAKEVSILVSWSLEAAIETSDSMEARGYGLPGRTSFHLFKMSPGDYRTLAAILVTGGVTFLGLCLGKTSVYFYPKLTGMNWDGLTIATFVSYILLMLIPIVIDISANAGKKVN